MNRRAVRLAQPRRRFHQRAEHCRQIECRAADDLEHVGGGGLLLQRVAQLVEQPCIFDRDHGLVGEGADQFDLLVREKLHFGAPKHDGAEGRALPQQGNSEYRAMAQFPGDCATFWKFLSLGLQIRHVDRSSFQHTAPADRAGHCRRHVTYRRQNRAVMGHGRQTIAHKAEDGYVVGATEPPGAFDQSIKH